MEKAIKIAAKTDNFPCPCCSYCKESSVAKFSVRVSMIFWVIIFLTFVGFNGLKLNKETLSQKRAKRGKDAILN